MHMDARGKILFDSVPQRMCYISRINVEVYLFFFSITYSRVIMRIAYKPHTNYCSIHPVPGIIVRVVCDCNFFLHALLRMHKVSHT